jgi:hypothetical protein
MTSDPLDVIDQACYLAFRFALKASVGVTDCLEIREGVYGLKQTAKDYHPLEAVLIAESVLSNDWTADVAAKLMVPAAWVEGFMDGFARSTENSNDQDYIQGFLAAEELRFRPGFLRDRESGI